MASLNGVRNIERRDTRRILFEKKMGHGACRTAWRCQYPGLLTLTLLWLALK